VTVTPGVAGSPGGLFTTDEPVVAGRDNGPKFGDEVWDFSALVVRQSQGTKRLYLDNIPEPYQRMTREMLMVLAQPTHPAVIAAGIVQPRKPAATSNLISIGTLMGAIAQWATERGLDAPSTWTPGDAQALLRDLGEGRGPTGVALQPGTLRHYVTALKRMREFGPVYSTGGLSFMPWGATPAQVVVGGAAVMENETSPMPWEMWSPLISAAWKIVSEFSDDIISANEADKAVSRNALGPVGDVGVQKLRDWLDAGNKIPLSTGVGLNAGQPRGNINITLLCRLVGINTVLLRPAHRSHREEATRILETAASDPQRCLYGGVYEPTATVTQLDGSQTTWVSEIGMTEARYFRTVLRGACWIIIASLTGMRDSEIQELRRGAITEQDGLPAISSTQFKGQASEIGQDRDWWAPEPVLRAIRVLERLITHDGYLFARGESESGVYAHEPDVARLVEFVNADPAERRGRGHGLGLRDIDVSSRVPINQQTLRRSFSVLAAQHPGAEIGLGIQLGHAALRMTTNYARDSQQQVAQLFNDERRVIARNQAATIITGAAPVSGKRDIEITEFRAQIVADDTRADAITDALADRYHVGTFNDCMFAAERAACGPEGPHLASQHCATSDCANALFLTRHRPTVEAQVARIDEWLDRGVGHPVVIERQREERAKLAAVLRDLNQEEEQ